MSHFERRVVMLHERPSDLGGSQASMVAEATALREQGWSVLLAYRESDTAAVDGAAFDFGVPAAPLFSQHPPRPAALRAAIDSLLEQTDASVLHVHLGVHGAALRALARRRPTVVTCHVPVCPNGARFRYRQEELCERRIGAACLTRGYRLEGCGTRADDIPYGIARFALGTVYSKWSVSALARCAQVIAPSAWQKERLVSDGVPEEIVTVLPPPIAERSSSDPPSRPMSRPVVLGAGRLVTLKGFHHLLRACAAAASEHEVHIAGEGPQRSALADLARELGLEDRTRFLGALTPEQLRRATAAADVVAVPSLWPETFGMVGPEAVLAGTPVVAYASGGARDWAGASSAVRPVATGDIEGLTSAIDAALNDRRRATEAARASFRELLAPARHASELDRIYHDAVKHFQQSAPR